MRLHRATHSEWLSVEIPRFGRAGTLESLRRLIGVCADRASTEADLIHLLGDAIEHERWRLN